jgi:hypothetical protein
MLGDGDCDLTPVDDLLLVVGQHRCPPRAAAFLMDAVKIDEIDGRPRAVDVGHTVPEAGADEGQVRIGIPGFALALFLAQLVAQLELVVAIIGPGRKELLKGPDEGATCSRLYRSLAHRLCSR